MLTRLDSPADPSVWAPETHTDDVAAACDYYDALDLTDILSPITSVDDATVGDLAFRHHLDDLHESGDDCMSQFASLHVLTQRLALSVLEAMADDSNRVLFRLIGVLELTAMPLSDVQEWCECRLQEGGAA